MHNLFDFVSRKFVLSVLLSAPFFLTAASFAQQPPPPRNERTIEEIKTEAISRAENGQYPCIGQNPDDLKEAFANIKTKDRDEWGAAFIAVGDRYMAEGKSLEKTDPAKSEAAKFWDPPMTIVHIPFEGKEIVGYLRFPKNTSGPVPLVIAVNGLDSRKEDLAESFAAILPY